MEESIIYTRVNYNGYIGCLNTYGPILHSYLTKSQVIMAVKEGFDVEILNESEFPEFAKEVKRIVREMRLGTTVEAINPVTPISEMTQGNDIIEKVIDEAITEVNPPTNPKIEDGVAKVVNAAFAGNKGSKTDKNNHGGKNDGKHIKDQLNGLDNLK